MILHEKFASWAQKMDLYLTTSASTFPCFQITKMQSMDIDIKRQNSKLNNLSS